jgi:glutathione S-transferase
MQPKRDQTSGSNPMHLFIGNKTSSSWSFRPWIAMRAFGIPFEETLVQLRTVATRENLLKHSPTGKVPVLADGETVVWDSLAIMEYLADRCPDKAIWPADRLARAHARCASAEMHAGFQPLRSQCGMAISRRYAARPRSPEVMADVARIVALWSEARARFGSQTPEPYLYGAFSAADAMFAPVVSRFQTYAIPVDENTRAYMTAVAAHPAYQAWRDGALKEPWPLSEDDGETIV